MGGDNHEVRTEEEDVRRRIVDLQRELHRASMELEDLIPNDKNGHSATASAKHKIGPSEATQMKEKDLLQPLSPPYKCGYLSKWNDRAIGGFSGTKAWDKRFVVLENGNLAYYKTHTDTAPRYVLSLKQCAVRDDGCKPVRVMKWDSKKGGLCSEPVKGRFYYVFSVYHRPLRSTSDGAAATPKVGEDLTTSHSAEDDDESQIVPLLRFSSQSLAEKDQWIDLISQSCAFAELQHECGEESFADDSSFWPTETSLRKPATPLPKAKPGTLPPIYFGLPAVPSRSKLSRFPSGFDTKNYRRKSKLETPAKSNPRSVSGYPPSRPMHRSATPSYLSAEAEVQNFRGLLNLALIILAVSNVRIILDTMRKYGCVLTTPPDLSKLTEAPLTDFPFLSGLALSHVLIVSCYFVEVALSRRIVGEVCGTILHVLVSNMALLVPMVITWSFIDRPIVGGTLLLYATIIWMKLISYAHANSDYRLHDSHHQTVALVRDLDSGATQMSYPKNVTLGNLYYFCLAPTLTYQISFPRSRRVRWGKVAGIIFRLSVATSFLFFLLAQVISPNLDSLVNDIEDAGGRITLHLVADYLLKLAIANTYVWLLIFYIFFHLFLNLSAELLRFGDRVFYKDWWNAAEVSAYWRLWNMPVHYWLVRHVYFPSIRRGLSRNAATLVVFFVSAVMHEVLLSVPFHFVRAWSFIGMMSQIPLSAFTKYLDRTIPGTSIGNVIFWLTFCVFGQPMAILLYTVDYWNLTSRGPSKYASFSSLNCDHAECEL